MENVQPFDEWMCSWNGLRPKRGKWTFWASLYQNKWSPWIRYAEWGEKSQKTFQHAPQGSLVESYQDAVYPKDGLCSSFRLKVEAEEGADLTQLESFYVSVSTLAKLDTSLPSIPLSTVSLLNVPRQSQFKLNHPRAKDLCSPTATSTAINFLLRSNQVDPVAFAAKIHDETFDIYGNWILNTAEAHAELKGKFSCHVERLSSFAALHAYLTRALPVVTSVRGPLPGSFHPLTFGHLICVIGFQAETKQVLCIDSAFPENEQTLVKYALKDFIDAWGRRQNIAYVFSPKHLTSTLETMMGQS